MEFAFKSEDVHCNLIEDCCGYFAEIRMKQNLTITSKIDKVHPWQSCRDQERSNYSVFNCTTSGAYEQNIHIVVEFLGSSVKLLSKDYVIHVASSHV